MIIIIIIIKKGNLIFTSPTTREQEEGKDEEEDEPFILASHRVCMCVFYDVFQVLLVLASLLACLFVS